MTIIDLRILPPFAIARVGSGPEPLDNYTVRQNPKHPLAFRRIEPLQTLVVDEQGTLTARPAGRSLRFKQDQRIRPVAPFLEVWAVTDEKPEELQPLTLDMLPKRSGELDLSCLGWHVRVANLKVYRRTDDDNDKVEARTPFFSDHKPYVLEGHCRNFISVSAFIDFGRVQFVRPTPEFPQIRLRFTPGTGAIYGPDEEDKDQPYKIDRARAIYRKEGTRWVGYAERTVDGKREVKKGAETDWEPQFNDTLPTSLYAIYPPAPSWQQDDELATSRGYFDDTCDGVVEFALRVPGQEEPLTAKARICSAPPAPVPDSFFVRTLADDLDQVIYGPDLPRDDHPALRKERAEEIVRRACETVRFLNVALMNGNAYKGLNPLDLDTMPELEAAEVTERAVRPVMPPATVDTLTILALHEHIFAAVRSGTAPWFLNALRLPHEAADFTDYGRRKMPALMVGADENYLALTYRQIDTIAKVVDASLFDTPLPKKPSPNETLRPRNRSAQLRYKAAGNPENTLLDTAVANCCPGLETDFRAVWRRIFKGIVLREYDNLVMDADEAHKDLIGHRVLKVDDIFVMARMVGPSPFEPDEEVNLPTESNPHGLQPLEWSNLLARILKSKDREGNFTWKPRVTCFFTKEVARDHSLLWYDDPATYIERSFDVAPFFERDTAFIAEELARPGELTQGLCSPWQNDFRECSCYYWASARPDYVNTEAAPNGLSQGDNWLQKKRTGDYVPDDYVDPRLVLYDDLFGAWEKWIRFQIGGRDAPGEET